MASGKPRGEGSPFQPGFVPSPPPRGYSVPPTAARDPVPWIVAAVAAFLAVGVGVWVYLELRRKDAPAPAMGDRFQNPGRNYSFQMPNRAWVADTALRDLDGADLAFQQSAWDATLEIGSEESTGGSPSLAQLRDQVTRRWRRDVSELRTYTEPAAMAGQSALLLFGEGNRSGSPIRMHAVVMAYRGIGYWLAFAAAKERFAAANEDFRAVWTSFQLLGDRPQWRGEEPTIPAGVYASRRHPYRLAAPGEWKEAPGLDVGSRFADLILVGPDKSATIVVSPRAAADVGQVRRAFVARQKKLFPNATIRDTGESSSGDVSTVDLFVDDPREAFFIVASFMEKRGAIYQIECRAPAELAATYRPLFARVPAGLEVMGPLKEAASEPAPEAAAFLPAKNDDKPAAKKDSPPTSKVSPKEEKKPGTKKKAPPPENPVAKPAPEVKKSSDGKPAPKRKSLDDLD